MLRLVFEGGNPSKWRGLVHRSGHAERLPRELSPRAHPCLLPPPSYDHPTCGPHGECPTGLTCSAQQICEGVGAADSGTPPDAVPRCFGSFVTVCFTTLADVPTMPAMIPGGSTAIDTGSSPMCDQHNDQVANCCVIAGAGVKLSAQTVRAYGAKPLILLSTSMMTIDAQSVIDVSSHLSVVPPDPNTGSAGTSSLTGSDGGPSGQGAIMFGGGGGGGGGAGFIRAPGVTTNISPPSFVP